MYKKLSDQDYNTHISDHVNYDVLNEIIDHQNKIKENNEVARRHNIKNEGKGPKKPIKKLEKYVILIDDLLDSKAFTSFFGGLSGLCTKNRHWNIVFIFSGQHYTKISPVI